MINSKIKISLVSYNNTLPFLYGLQNSRIIEKIDLSPDYPAICADKLIKNEVDIGLIPVAVLPELKDYRIISDYCIGAEGEVASVLLLSDCELESIKKIHLDYQSRTSVKLVKILAGEYWKINPGWKNTKQDFEKKTGKNEAAVIIGDRAFKYRNNFKFSYDLSAEWKKYTGLPFVFAVWAANKSLDENFIAEFDKSLKSGIENIDKVVKNYSSEIDLYKYLSQNIDYDFNERKKQALNLFLSKLENVL